MMRLVIMMRLALAMLFAVAAISIFPQPLQAKGPSSRPARPAAEIRTLRITDTVLRLPPGGRGSGAVYLVIENTSDTPERLLGARAAAARETLLHRTVMQGDMAKMVHDRAWTIPAKGRLVLSPGGRHLMLIGLTPKTKPGDQVPIVLQLEQAGAVRIVAPARPIVDAP